MAARTFDVLLTQGAEQDLESIYDYICAFDSVANADRVLDALMDAVSTLSRFPERGSCPKELLGLGIRDYRQVFLKRTASFTASRNNKSSCMWWWTGVVTCKRC